MDPLTWLGLRKSRVDNPTLSVIHDRVRGLLPDDEPVVVRYIVVVAVLLTRIIHADGRVVAAEMDCLRGVLQHIEGMPPEEIDELCQLLNEQAPHLTQPELASCFSELKALCDGSERREVLRLLAQQASSDGEIEAAEHGALLEIARALGVPEEEVRGLEKQALRESEVSVDSASDLAESVAEPPSAEG